MFLNMRNLALKVGRRSYFYTMKTGGLIVKDGVADCVSELLSARDCAGRAECVRLSL